MKSRLNDTEIRVIKVGQKVICQALREFFVNNAERLMDVKLDADDCLHITISSEIDELTMYAYRDPDCKMLFAEKINDYIDENIDFTTDTLYNDTEATKMYSVFQKSQAGFMT